jgi:hypothetical protein
VRLQLAFSAATCSAAHGEMSILQEDWKPDGVTVEKVDVSPWEGRDKFCIVVHNVLTVHECDDLIAFSENKNYEPALINIGGGRQKLMANTRNNDRCIYDDPVTVEKIWQRVLKSLQAVDPDSYNTLVDVPFINNRLRQNGAEKVYSAVGLNERMRYLRYDAGTFFAPHFDGSYVRSLEAGPEREGERSFVTFQAYLNEGFKGGATRFLSVNDTENHDGGGDDTPSFWPAFLTSTKRPSGRNPHYNVVPRTGSVLLFQHDCCHEGARLISGRKYAIRSDVMYSTAGPGSEYSVRPVVLASQEK